jgi:hypothetical protein
LVVQVTVMPVAEGVPAEIEEMVGAVVSLGDAEVVKLLLLDTFSFPETSVERTR